jgi:hypothetical protein
MRLIPFLLTHPRAGVTFLRCIACAIVVRLIWWMPFRAFRKSLTPTGVWLPEHQAVCEEAARLITPAYSVLRHDAGCLERATALQLVLASFGIPAQVILGGVMDGNFSAHAWVEAGPATYLRGDNPAWERISGI